MWRVFVLFEKDTLSREGREGGGERMSKLVTYFGTECTIARGLLIHTLPSSQS